MLNPISCVTVYPLSVANWGGVFLPWYLAIVIYVGLAIVRNIAFSDFRYAVNTNPVLVGVNVLFLNGIVAVYLIWRGVIQPTYDRFPAFLCNSFEWLGRNSLYVYLTHILVVWYLQIFLWDLIGDKFDSVELFFVCYAVASLALIPLAAYCSRHICKSVERLLFRK